MPSSRIKAEIARILQDEGYIQGFKLLDESAPRRPRRSRRCACS
jgi:ribosomal protein S8